MKNLQAENTLFCYNSLTLKDLWNGRPYKKLITKAGLPVSSRFFPKKHLKNLFRNRQYANHAVEFSTYLLESAVKVVKSDGVFDESRKDQRWGKEPLRRIKTQGRVQKQDNLLKLV